MDKIKSVMGQYLFEEPERNFEEPERNFDNEKKTKEDIDPYLIGELIIEFNGLESDVEMSFCDQIHESSHELGMMIIGSMSYSQKCMMRYKYLARLFSFDENEKRSFKIEKINKELSELGTFRNRVVHGFREDRDEFGYTRTSNSQFSK